MPVKRRLPKSREHRVTPEAIAAFEAGDYHGLHRALGLRPWEESPLPASITALGVDPDSRPDWATDFWPRAVELQGELLAAGARMPTRAATGAD